MNENAKMLLADSRNAFRGLHLVLGMDFEAPYGIERIKGRYTANQVVKTATAGGYVPGDLLVILTADRSRPHGWNAFRLATVTAAGGVEIDYKVPWVRDGIDNFCAKRYFEEVRKSPEAETFILWQGRQYLKKPAEKVVELVGRFDVVSAQYGSYNGQRYVDSIELRRRDSKGEKFRREIVGRVYYAGKKYPATLEDVFDQSGYYVRARRKDLKRRAAALRAEREKAAFEASDNTDKVLELEKRIRARKAEILRALEAAETAEEIAAVSESLARWKGLAGVVSDFNRFRANVAGKVYKSIADCERAYNDILGRC